MAVTLNDIAQACEVSKRTVSEILNRKGKPYSPKTVERVFAAAERLGYRPNAQARAIAAGKVGTVALVLGEEHCSHLPQELLHGIHQGLAAADFKLMVTVLSDAQLSDDQFIPEILTTLMADGLLINYHYRFPPHLLEAIDRFRIPAVWINIRRDHDAVCFDEGAAANAATQRLLDLGHRRIAYLDRALEKEEAQGLHYSSYERRDGYLAAMAAAGSQPQVLTGLSPGTTALAADWVARADRPTAVLCYNRHSAQDLATACIAAGMTIPGDLAILTFSRGYHGVPCIPGYEQPWTELGVLAAETLVRRLASEGPLPSVALPLGFVSGDTLTPPP